MAQLLGLLGLIPALFLGALLVLVPLLLSLGLVWRYCTETRGRDLRTLDSADATEAGYRSRFGPPAP